MDKNIEDKTKEDLLLELEESRELKMKMIAEQDYQSAANYRATERAIMAQLERMENV